jgi:chromosome segregation ATPase
LLLALLFSAAVGVLQAEEPGQWYLISEPELRSIEQYKANSEREKQNWLSQVRELQTTAANSTVRSVKLEADSVSLNQRLAREQTERESWQTQARQLQKQAGNSETRANRLALESERLNTQLAQAREMNRKLEQSYNESEAAWLTLTSLTNGEIADLKQALADRTLEAESYKGKAVLRLVIIIALLVAIARYTAFRVGRFFRII